MKKIKILTLSDNPLAPSGVATQTRYMIEGLLDTGRYQIVSLGGAIRHQDYRPIKLEKYKDDWVIIPVDDYGNQDIIRSVMQSERPDFVWIMTDPRFWPWLWDMDNEIRVHAPLVYYHVWDNYPYPHFNKKFYESNDVVACISKLTHDVVQNVSPDLLSERIPHTVNSEVFKKMDKATWSQIVPESILEDDRVTFFWNNRNARRKQSGTLLWWFKEFLDEVGHEKARLIMHTDPGDVHGQDLIAIINHLKLDQGQTMLSTDKLSKEHLACLYNLADCTVNISDAEGFGLSTLESLSCETPIIVNMTGGLQEQVTDGTKWFGVGIEPASKSVIGSQDVPWIYEDRVAKKDFIDALKKMLFMSSEERGALGASGRKHVLDNYGYSDYIEKWDKLFTKLNKDMGSWETRKGYKPWRFEEVL